MRVEVEGARLFFDVEGPKLRPVDGQLRERPTVIVVHTGPTCAASGGATSPSRSGGTPSSGRRTRAR